MSIETTLKAAGLAIETDFDAIGQEILKGAVAAEKAFVSVFGAQAETVGLQLLEGAGTVLASGGNIEVAAPALIAEATKDVEVDAKADAETAASAFISTVAANIQNNINVPAIATTDDSAQVQIPIAVQASGVQTDAPVIEDGQAAS